MTCFPAGPLLVRAAITPPSLAVIDPTNVALVSGSTKDVGAVGRGLGGTYKDLTLQIRNVGGQILSILSAAVSPSTQFTVITPPSPGVFAGMATTMTIRYVPSAGASDSAALTLSTNDAQNTTFNLSLTGAGVSVGTGLTNYYPLDGNLNDGSGNGFDGTVVGSIGYATGRGGVPGTAALLDGSGVNYFQANTPAGWAWNSTYTISAWVLTSQTNFSVLFKDRAGLCTTGLEFGYNAGNYQISRDSFTCGGWTFTSMAASFATDQWQHVVYVSNGGNVTVYLNGAVAASGTISNINAPTAGSVIVYFGRGAFMQWLAGSLDDVRIYNATALTGPQVQALYNQD